MSSVYITGGIFFGGNVKVGDFVIYTDSKMEWLDIVVRLTAYYVDLCTICVKPNPPRGTKPPERTYNCDWVTKDPHYNFKPIIPQINVIMQGHAFPPWVGAIIATTGQTATKTSANTLPVTTGYPVGTILEGSGGKGNFWIVNKHNSLDVSLLWNGAMGKFCTNELEKQDNFKDNKRLPISVSTILTTVKQAKLPRWAWDLVLVPNGVLNQPQVPVVPVVPQVLQNWAADYIKPVEIKVDLPVDSCNHEFKEYIGFMEVYQYCVHCDKKKDVPK